MDSFKKYSILLFLIFLMQLIQKSHCINCYQCSGTDNKTPFECNEFLEGDSALNSQPCDNVYGANYCIKHVGRFEAKSIACFQCSSVKSLECSDLLIHSGYIQSKNCSNVYGAQYCIKSLTLDGGFGTKRFCSSLNLGNYCNNVQQPGDLLTYRTCIYTCSGNSCNSANSIKITKNFVFISMFINLYFFTYFI